MLPTTGPFLLALFPLCVRSLPAASEFILFLPPALPTSTALAPTAIAPAPAATAPTPTANELAPPLLMAYYPDWALRPPETIDLARFDWIDFAFAVPDHRALLAWDGSDHAPDLLRRLVAHAHRARKSVKLSIGGWSGSKAFSSAVRTPQNRAALAASILAIYAQYGIDGIDIDWEYPGQPGAPGNSVSPDDSANFLDFLRLLRATLPPRAVITAAAQTVPFAGPDGAPLRNLSDFAAVLDWVLLMNYDVWGASDPPGPNAPLSDACANASQPDANAVAALAAWTAAGFAPSQLVLGVPSYGYLSASPAQRLRTRRPWGIPWVDALLKTQTPDDDVDGAGVRLLADDDGGTDAGQVQFRELVRQGALAPYPFPFPVASNASTSAIMSASTSTSTSASTGTNSTGANTNNTELAPRRLFAGANGFVREWDACSSTPFLRAASAAGTQVVAYDDPESLALKGAFVRQAGMRGVNLFDLSGDTDEWDLTDALRVGLGLVAV